MRPPWREISSATCGPQAASAASTPAVHIGACAAAPTSRNEGGLPARASNGGARSQSSQPRSCNSAANSSCSESGSAKRRSNWPEIQACAGWLIESSRPPSLRYIIAHLFDAGFARGLANAYVGPKYEDSMIETDCREANVTSRAG